MKLVGDIKVWNLKVNVEHLEIIPTCLLTMNLFTAIIEVVWKTKEVSVVYVPGLRWPIFPCCQVASFCSYINFVIKNHSPIKSMIKWDGFKCFLINGTRMRTRHTLLWVFGVSIYRLYTGEHRTKDENTTAMGCLTTKSIAKWTLVWVL